MLSEFVVFCLKYFSFRDNNFLNTRELLTDYAHYRKIIGIGTLSITQNNKLQGEKYSQYILSKLVFFYNWKS